MMLPLHFLQEGDLFLDIGANVGTYTVLASGVCRARRGHLNRTHDRGAPQEKRRDQ